jgi:hypothetical protein
MGLRFEKLKAQVLAAAMLKDVSAEYGDTVKDLLEIASCPRTVSSFNLLNRTAKPSLEAGISVDSSGYAGLFSVTVGHRAVTQRRHWVCPTVILKVRRSLSR